MSKTVEEWRPVVGYEGLYEVSDWGNVRSVDRNIVQYCHLIKQNINRLINGITKAKHNDKDGYELTNLKKDGKHKTMKVHRLVAEAFIPNPNGKPIVHHKNHNKSDNRLENLEWATSKENLGEPIARKNMSEAMKGKLTGEKNPFYGKHHSDETKQKMRNSQPKKPVYQYTLDGALVRIWPSTAECGRNGYWQSNVSACCLGKAKTHKGYKWSYTPLQ